VLGTPAYMPPEQARGQLGRVDARSDVYSLGATLYELLADRPLFQDRDVYAILRKVVEEEPAPLRRFNPRVEADLETVVMKCVEKDPARRYGSAGELADDLERWRGGEPIQAHPPSVFYGARKWASKRKAVLLPVAAAILIGVSFAGWALGRSASTSEAVALIEAGRPALDQAFRYLYGKDAVYEELVKRVEKGQGLLEQAVAKAPRLPSAHYLLGRAWELRGWDDKAEAGYRRAIELDPEFGPARYQLGRLLLTKSVFARFGTTSLVRKVKEAEADRLAAEAAREFDAAKGRSVFDDRLQATVAEGWAAFARRDRVAMERIAVEGIRAHGSAEGVEELHVLHAFAQPQAEQLPSWDRALDLRPKYALALFCRAVVRPSVQIAQAVEDYTQALKIHPRLAVAWINRGDLRARQGELDAAIADYTEAGRVSPGDPVPLSNRASTRLDQADWDGAIADCDAALRIDARYVLAYTIRASARFQKGDAKGAMADFEAGLRLDPQNAETLNDRSLVRKAMGDLAGAKEDVEAALKANPECVEAWVNQGILLCQAGEMKGSVAAFTRAIELDPRNILALSNRGAAWLELGELAKAIEDCTRTLAVQPRMIDALHNRGLARQLAGDMDGAIADGTEAIRLKGDDAEAYFNRGNAYDAKRQFAKAMADYDVVIRLRPRYPEAYANRANVRLKTLDRDGGLKDLRKTLEVAPADWPHRAEVEALLRQLGASR